jgi:curved DNA-binding protein CbpA
MINHYEVLGVAKFADSLMLKRAYRSLAQKYHPDKETGDAALFRQVQKAYEVLSDPERRAAYDENGLDDSSEKLRQEAMGELAKMLMMFIGHINPETDDLICKMREHMRGQNMQIKDQKRRMGEEIKRCHQILSRLSSPDKDNLFSQIIKGNIATCKQNLGILKRGELLGKEIEKVLSEYSYRTDPKKQYDHSFTVGKTAHVDLSQFLGRGGRF